MQCRHPCRSSIPTGLNPSAQNSSPCGIDWPRNIKLGNIRIPPGEERATLGRRKKIIQPQRGCRKEDMGRYSTPSGLGMFVARFFFFNDSATTEIYTLSLHDALPI